MLKLLLTFKAYGSVAAYYALLERASVRKASKTSEGKTCP